MSTVVIPLAPAYKYLLISHSYYQELMNRHGDIRSLWAPLRGAHKLLILHYLKYWPPFFQDQEIIDDQEKHRRAFEAGRIDYMGQDRFQHIQEYLDSHLDSLLDWN